MTTAGEEPPIERVQKRPSLKSPPLGHLDLSWREADSARHAIQTFYYYIKELESGSGAASGEAGSNLGTWYETLQGIVSGDVSGLMLTASGAGGSIVGGILGNRHLKAQKLAIVAEHLLAFCKEWSKDSRAALHHLDDHVHGAKSFVYDGISQDDDHGRYNLDEVFTLAKKYAPKKNVHKNKRIRKARAALSDIRTAFSQSHSISYTRHVTAEFMKAVHGKAKSTEENFDLALRDLSLQYMPLYYLLHNSYEIELPSGETFTEKFHKRHFSALAKKTSKSLDDLCKDRKALKAIRGVSTPVIRFATYLAVAPVVNLINIRRIAHEISMGFRAAPSLTLHFRFFSNSVRTHYKVPFKLPEHTDKKQTKGLFSAIQNTRASIREGIGEVKFLTSLFALETGFFASHLLILPEHLKAGPSHALVSVHALLLASEAFGYLGKQIVITRGVLESDKAKLAAGYGDLHQYALDTVDDSLDNHPSSL